jgi:hypothetical protein
MKRLNLLVTSTAVTISLVVISVPDATATSPLFIMSQGHIVSPGTLVGEEAGVAVNGLRVEGREACFAKFYGTLISNAKTTDKLAFTEGGGLCGGGYFLRGEVKQVELTGTGKLVLTYKPKLGVQTPGGCLYEAGKLTGSASVAGEIHGHASAVGKLNSANSGPACAKTATLEVGASEEIPVQFENPLTHFFFEDETYT